MINKATTAARLSARMNAETKPKVAPIKARTSLWTVLDAAVAELRPAIGWALVFTLVITLLGFAGPLYMVNLYGRVLSSRNETTLVVLTLIVIFAMVIQAVMETLRADILRRASVMFDRTVAGDVFDAIQRGIVQRPMDPTSTTLRDVDTMRDFITGPGLSGLLALPFFPIFIVVCWIIHPAFVVLVLVTAGLVAVVNYFTSLATAEPVREASKAQQTAGQRAGTAFQNFESVHSMGMRPALRRSWLEMHDSVLSWNIVADDRSVTLRVVGAFVRRLGNTGVLALAGFLVLSNDLSPALIFAVSIIVGQATQPLQGLVGAWRGIVGTRQAFERVQALLRDTAAEPRKMQMRKPAGQLAVSDLVVAPPGKGVEGIVLRGINFEVPAGTILAVIGPSASGKSSLARALLGVWKPLHGTIRIDGTDIRNWNDEELGPSFGYLPQTVDLFPGTVAENIARFTEASHDDIIGAAERAGIHSMVQDLPQGYNTRIGDQGQGLSGGQRQRIGLARALFGRPAIVVLDEPNASLDAIGEEHLAKAIRQMREEKITVVFITHKVNIVSIADAVIVLGGGTMKDYGRYADVMQRIVQPSVVQLRPGPEVRAAAAIT